MSVLRRLRGIAGTAGIWGVAFAAVSALIVLATRAFGSPIGFGFGRFIALLAGVALRWGVVGAGTGLLFAATVIFAERQRTFSTLSPRRFTLWGFAAGAVIPFGITTAYALARHAPLEPRGDSSSPSCAVRSGLSLLP